MNNINLGNSNTYYPEKNLPEKLTEFVSPCEDFHYVGQKASYDEHIILRIKLATQSIFRFICQVFECISYYACLLANGLISIKAKLLGVDFHLHLQLFTINIHHGSPNMQNVPPGSILTC
ncbi:hypothetical protein [Candidatus Protochlamydia sp. W-9]|uniref:hypothetical protein n=1 Tax=Candidatus Protochlamydia sp. W-9 TaxID=1785087 RepID=UPI00096A32DD|nr:hypothetical protein [Candidatus Protochlamydia sp. W-9]